MRVKGLNKHELQKIGNEAYQNTNFTTKIKLNVYFFERKKNNMCS